jgi:hypothetical protein
MTVIPIPASAARRLTRAKPIFYARSAVALAMIAGWVLAAVSGIVLWLAPDGRQAFAQPAALGFTKQAWDDFHVVVSFLAVGLTLAHVTVMRRGILSYARLVLTGRRAARASGRKPKRIVYVRASAVVVMAVVVPLVVLTGVVPWLAPDVRRAGQQLLLFSLTKHTWTDVHTVVAAVIGVIALTHLVVVRTGLMADLRLIATGQRSAPRRAVQPRA